MKRSPSSNLPNMFKQQEVRQQEFMRQKSSRPVSAKDKKDEFSNFLDRFEDEQGRLRAKAKMQQLILEQKEKQRLQQQTKKDEEGISERAETAKAGKSGEQIRDDDRGGGTKKLQENAPNAKEQHKPEKEVRTAEEVTGNPIVERQFSYEAVPSQITSSEVIIPEVCKIETKLNVLLPKKEEDSTTMKVARGLGSKPSNQQPDKVAERSRAATLQARKSKEEMQNYLLSHLLFDEAADEDNDVQVPKKKNSIDDLFDGLEAQEMEQDQLAEFDQLLADMDKRPDKPVNNKQTVANKDLHGSSQENRKRRDSIDELFEQLEEPSQGDPGHVQELESFYSLLHEDNKPERKPRKKQLLQSNNDNNVPPKLKIVEINNIRNRFETTPTTPLSPPASAGSGSSRGLDEKVGKVKGFFETVYAPPVKEVESQQQQQTKQPPARQGKLLNSDLLSKFNSPEKAEQLKRQKDQEREERRLSRMAKLEEERRRQEEAERLERERVLEEERQRKMLENVMREEKERAEARRKKEAETKRRRETNEPQLRKMKVLDRIPHMFDNSREDNRVVKAKPAMIVGQLNADDLFAAAESSREVEEKKVFQDPTLTGVSQMVIKMRSKLDPQNVAAASKQPLIATKKKNWQPVAVEPKSPPVPPPKATQWSWKSKKQQQQACNSNKTELKKDKEKHVEKMQPILLEVAPKANTLNKNQDPPPKVTKNVPSASTVKKDPKAKAKKSPIVKMEDLKQVTLKSTPKDKVQKTIEPTVPAVTLKAVNAKDKVQKQPTEHDILAIKRVQQQLLDQIVSKSEKKAAATTTQAPPITTTTRQVKMKFSSLPPTEWRKIQMDIIGLHNILTNNSHLLPQPVTTQLQSLKKSLLELHEIDNQERAYKGLKTVLQEHYLRESDVSTKEIDFKSEVERRLDYIEMHLAAAFSRAEKTAGMDPAEVFKLSRQLSQPSMARPNQAKQINDLKNRVVRELSKNDDDEEDKVCIAKIAATPKRKFHDKCAQLQRCLDNLAGTDPPAKSLQEVKAETESKKWKWKETQLRDLEQFMSAHNKEMPSDIRATQRRLQEYGKELKDKETTATTRRDVEEIKRIREDKDQEFRAFLKGVRDYVDQSDSRQSEFMQGVQGYIDLIEDDGPMGTRKEKPSLYDRSVSGTKAALWNFSARNKMLQKNFEGEDNNENNNEGKVGRNFSVRKACSATNLGGGGNEEDFNNFSLRPAGCSDRVAAMKAAKEALAMKKKNNIPRQQLKDDWRNIQGVVESTQESMSRQGQKLGGGPQKPPRSSSSTSSQQLLTPVGQKVNSEDIYQLYLAGLKSGNVLGGGQQQRGEDQQSKEYKTFCLERDDVMEELKDVRGRCANMKSVFESGQAQQQIDSSAVRMRKKAPPVVRSQSCANMRNVFENGELQTPMSEDNSKFQLGDEEKSKVSSSKIRQMFEAGLSANAKSASNEIIPLGKSSSFGKFREAFESGSTADLLEEEKKKQPQKLNGVMAELAVIKQSPRLQNLLRINKPKESLSGRPNPLSKSRTTSSLELDEKTKAEVSRSKAAIKNMFESSAGKVTYGGSSGSGGLKKSSTDPSQLGTKPKVRKTVSNNSSNNNNRHTTDFTERKWVFDTINKYFDVIKEDSEEEEGESDDMSCSSYSASNRSSAVFSRESSAANSVAKMFQQGSPSPSPIRTAPPKEPAKKPSSPEAVPSSSLARSGSSSKLRDMVASIARSRSSLGLDKFKENLNSHLKMRASTESLNNDAASPFVSRRTSTNLDPGVNDSDEDDEDLEEVTLETAKYSRVKL